ncbi:MAG: response regulator [Acidobacteriaceae bacterium]
MQAKDFVLGRQVVGRQQVWRSSDVCFDRRPERPKEFVNNKRSLISVVDDDESIRESLPDLLRVFGFEAETFSSAEEFLASDELIKTSCLILDIAMPSMTGPELQRELKIRQHKIPIIFITASRDESIRSRLLKEGAVECLFKPFSDSDLLKALNTSLRTN